MQNSWSAHVCVEPVEDSAPRIDDRGLARIRFRIGRRVLDRRFVRTVRESRITDHECRRVRPGGDLRRRSTSAGGVPGSSSPNRPSHGACREPTIDTSAGASGCTGVAIPRAATLTTAPTRRCVATTSAATPASSNPTTPIVSAGTPPPAIHSNAASASANRSSPNTSTSECAGSRWNRCGATTSQRSPASASMNCSSAGVNTRDSWRSTIAPRTARSGRTTVSGTCPAPPGKGAETVLITCMLSTIARPPRMRTASPGA